MHRRIATLQAVFTDIANERMAGLPLLNPRLQVEAIGFERWPDAPQGGPGSAPPLPAPTAPAAPDDSACALGVLVTPWFMNLVCLPLRLLDQPQAVGQRLPWQIAGQRFDFLVAHEPALGCFAACSLFSPMQDFSDAETARATALMVLQLLRQPPEQPPAHASADASSTTAASATAAAAASASASPIAAPAVAAPATASLSSAIAARPSGPARRGFLFGRSAATR